MYGRKNFVNLIVLIILLEWNYSRMRQNQYNLEEDT